MHTLSPIGTLLWFVFCGPLFLVGWGVLHITKPLNRLASIWCRALLALYPIQDDEE